MIQYWKHNITGEIYAVDVLDHEITNAYGPLKEADFSRHMAKNLDFNFDNSVNLNQFTDYADDFSTIQMDD